MLVSTQVPTGAPADSAALTAAINSQAGKLAALESQVALAQQRLADKADAGATGALRYVESPAEILQKASVPSSSLHDVMRSTNVLRWGSCTVEVGQQRH